MFGGKMKQFARGEQEVSANLTTAIDPCILCTTKKPDYSNCFEVECKNLDQFLAEDTCFNVTYEKPDPNNHENVTANEFPIMCQLALHNVNISHFPWGKQKNFTNLTKIILNKGSITQLNEMFSGIPKSIQSNVKQLELKHNGITIIPSGAFERFIRLHRLDLSHNKIESLDSEDFFFLRNVSLLDLNSNLLKELEKRTFQHMPMLEYLSLQHNLLTYIHHEAFWGLNRLKDITLTDNKLTTISSGTFALPQIETLIIERNKLTTFTGSLIEAPTLFQIFLGNNSITAVEENALPYFAMARPYHPLRYYLYHNQLTTFPDKILAVYNNTLFNRNKEKHQSHPVVGMFEGNPWICDCRIARFLFRLRQKYQINMGIINSSIPIDDDINSTQLVCQSPADFAGKPLLEIELTELNCANVTVPAEVCHQNEQNSTNPEECKKLRQRICASNSQSCICSSETNCFVCPNGYYGKHQIESATCLSCPLFKGGGYGAQSVTECECMAGFEKGPEQCQECPVNTSKSTHGPHQCQNCGENSQTFYSAAETCECDPGYLKDVTSGNCVSVLSVTVNTTESPDSVSQDSGILSVATAVSSGLTIAGIAAAVLYRLATRSKIKEHNKGMKLAMNHMLQNMNLPQATENFYTNIDNFNGLMVEIHQIQFDSLLGTGAFGQVHKAIVRGLKNENGPVTAAIKSLKEGHTSEEKEALQTELQQLIYVGHHPNIINLLGFVSTDETLMLIIEYAKYGDLLKYLKTKVMSTDYAQLQFESQTTTVFTSYAAMDGSSNYTYMQPNPPLVNSNEENNGNDISIKTLLSIAWQVAKGMDHLARMKCIHRDLAARNVLMSEGLVAKVSDFGLARAVYESGYYFKETKGCLPFKWMPPEALTEGQYTTKSDVWSFGILLWEIFTLGGKPYPGVAISSFLDLLQSGYRMAKPNNCPADVYEIMKSCWLARPSDRPEFRELADSLDRILQKAANLEYMEIHNYVNEDIEVSEVRPNERLIPVCPPPSMEEKTPHLTNPQPNSEYTHLLMGQSSIVEVD